MDSESPQKARKAKSPRRRYIKQTVSWGWLYGVVLGFMLMGFILGLFPTPKWTWGAVLGGSWALILTVSPGLATYLPQWRKALLGLIALAGAMAIAVAIATTMNLAVEVSAELSETILKGLLGDIALVTALVVMGVGALTITVTEASDLLARNFNRFGIALILFVLSGIGLGAGALIGGVLDLE